jgi:PAS domain S-box-containing protein
MSQNEVSVVADDAPPSGGVFVGPILPPPPSVPAIAAEALGLVADAQERIAEEARLMLELRDAIIDQLPDAKVVVDQAGRIVMVNRQTELMFGYTRGQLLGQTVEMLLPERLRERHEQHRQNFADDPRTRPMGQGLELVGRRKDGREIAIEIMLAPIVISAGSYALAIVRRKRG